jgi:hypothetical protein
LLQFAYNTHGKRGNLLKTAGSGKIGPISGKQISLSTGFKGEKK